METVHADHSRILVGRGRFTNKDLLSGSAALGTFTFPAASSSVHHRGREGGVGPAGRRFPCTLLEFRSLVGGGAAAACELMCEQAEEEPSEPARVRLFHSAPQRAFYSPARRACPHPDSRPSRVQPHPAPPLLLSHSTARSRKHAAAETELSFHDTVAPTAELGTIGTFKLQREKTNNNY